MIELRVAQGDEEIATYLRVDSLSYLSLGGLLAATGEGEKYCDACFTGNYPVSFAQGHGKDVFEELKSGQDIQVKPLSPAEGSG